MRLLECLREGIAHCTWSTAVEQVAFSFASHEPTLCKRVGGLSSRPSARVVLRRSMIEVKTPGLALKLDSPLLPRLGSIRSSHARAELACGGASVLATSGSEEVPTIARGVTWPPGSDGTVLQTIGSERSTSLASKPSDVASDVASGVAGDVAASDVAKEGTSAEAAWHEWCVRSTLTCDQKRRRAGQEAGGGWGCVRPAARRGGAERGARGV